jgi:hypothetical protein
MCKAGREVGPLSAWADVEPLIAQELEHINAGTDGPTGRMSLTEFVEKHYLPWCETNRSAATASRL